MFIWYSQINKKCRQKGLGEGTTAGINDSISTAEKKNGEGKEKLVKISEGKFYLSYNTMVMKVTCT